MFYQVTMTCYFTEYDEAFDFFHDGDKALPKADVINPNQPNMEFSSIELLENHHDTDPSEPCKRLHYKDNQPPPPD
ncbi:unnamed protein product [marine sediment metagenome]|uniref:Uncharacterized protein n=1 Tax=marine sediment metagenome TaxID=412755 RepID=X1NVY4_9ZZZZ